MMDLEEIKSYDDSWWLEFLRRESVFDADNIKAQKDWLVTEVERLQRRIVGLEDSLQSYKEESDIHEKSTHVEDFIYEINVSEKGEIPCLIKVNSVEHSFGITERDAKSFVHIFKMSKMK